MGKMINKALKMAVGMKAIKKIADKKKLPIQIAKEMAEEKELPIQQIAALGNNQAENEAENDVESLSEEEIKRRQLRNSVAATTGAGTTLLG